jgi:hypothetical protein
MTKLRVLVLSFPYFKGLTLFHASGKRIEFEVGKARQAWN